MKVYCSACDEDLDVHTEDDLDDHIRVLHPDKPPLERWPDGEVVVNDQTLQPSDFGGQP